MTVELADHKTATVAITSSAAGAVLNATSYQMNDVHTTIEDVLA